MTDADAGVGRQQVQFPGAIQARLRWSSHGRPMDAFGVSEGSGTLTDYGALEHEGARELCHAELRVESPAGSWTARFASQVFDVPQGVLWDTPGLLLVKYGFRLYALRARTGELAWSFTSATPALAVLSSTRLDHVLLQTEIETFALRADGEVAWRAAHSEVVVEAQLVAGRLDLTLFDGRHMYLDAQSGAPS